MRTARIVSAGIAALTLATGIAACGGGEGVPATEDLDPDGLALQEALLVDGMVTLAKFESAVAGMASCLERQGIEVERWAVTRDEGWSIAIMNDAENQDEAAFDICYYSYVDEVSRER